MDKANWDRIQVLFHEAASLPKSDQRAFLEASCGGDPALLSAVMTMLDEDSAPASFLDRNLGEVAHALLDSASFASSGDRFGPYRIRKLLGEGGMGLVYLAEREDIGMLVAIKLLRDATLSPLRRARFASESRTLGKLDHPFIARILDAGALDDGAPWFVMEYVDGTPITEYCRARNSSIDERLRLFRSLCEAVQYAHSQTYIHRDIKPSNVLVKADGAVKLLDFGIAKHLESDDAPVDRTRTALRAMTVAYASPEQVRGDRLGIQSDVYSLGALLYELLTAHPPFDLSGISNSEAERIILNQEPRGPSAVVEGGWSVGKTRSGELDVLITTAMHKDLGRRYRSVEAFIRDIDHYLKIEPLEARPDSVGYRLGKFVRRNRRSIAATVAVSAIIASLVLFFVVRLARARTAAVAQATRAQRIEQFMLNLFDNGDRTAGPSTSLQAVTLLDRGARNAQALSSEPAVQADLYRTLGLMYEKLGKLDRAEPLLRLALDKRKTTSGADSQDTADSLIALGLLREDQGQTAEAERMIRQGLAMERRTLPPNDPAIARALTSLARVLEEKGVYDEAVRSAEEAMRLQSQRQELAPDLSDTLAALATANYYLGHLEQALSFDRRALELDRRLYGNSHPRVADHLLEIGELEHDLGRDKDAEREYRAGLAIKQSWYGTEHPDTAMMMAAVGQSLIYQGRLEEAEPILQQALAIQERIFGKVHPQVAQGVNTLALLDLRRGRLSDAEHEFQRMADINRAVFDDRHYLVGIALLNLGEVYLAEKNYEKAEHSYREAIARFKEKLPPGHPNTGITEFRLGHVLVLERRYSDAEPHLLAGYQTLSKQPGPNATRIQNARKDLVAMYEALQRPDEAAKYRASSAKQ